MVRRQAVWLAVATTAAGVWLAGCDQSPAAPGQSTFKWTVTPSLKSLEVEQGAAGTFAIRLDSKVNLNADVAFSVSGTLPLNSTATFVPQRLGSTGRDAGLTIQTTALTPIGSYPLTITATEIGDMAHDMPVRLDVLGPAGVPDFLLEVDPAAITLGRGSGPTIQFIVRPVNGFSGTVSVSVDGISVPPAPVRIASPVTPPELTFASGDGGKGGTFVLALADRSSYPSTWTLTVRAASGSTVHTRTLNITINTT